MDGHGAARNQARFQNLAQLFVKRSGARPLLALALEGAALAADARPSVFGFGRQRLRVLGRQAGSN